jgi:hypothetical protein
VPKRTMTVSRLWYHPFRKTDEAGQVADLPDGSDMLDMFTEFVEHDIDRERLVRTETETYIAIVDVERKGRSITIRFESGRFGERGSIKDRRTHEVKGVFGEDDAPAVITHGVLLVPRIGTSVLGFIERSAGQGGMALVLDLFTETFNAKFPQHRMKRESILRKEAWLQAASLTQVRGTIRKQTTDVASDNQHQMLGNLVHTLVPAERHGVLPRWLWEHMKNNKLEGARYLGLAEDTDLDTLDIEVTFSDGVQQKTFEIDTEKTAGPPGSAAGTGRSRDGCSGGDTPRSRGRR